MEGASLEHGALTIAAAWPAGSKQNALAPARIHGGAAPWTAIRPRKTAPKGRGKKPATPGATGIASMDQTCDKLSGQGDLDGITILVQNIQARLGYVSRLLFDTMIFLAINPRQVICEELA
jgi:hypothetical protein